MTNIKQLWVKFRGSSMSPFLSPGDELLLQLHDTSKDNFKCGQIVLYRDQKEWIAHRIIGRDQNQLEMKGDRGLGRDFIPSDSVVGVVIGTRSPSGRIHLWQNGLHPMARAMALLSAEIHQEGLRLTRWPFYACMRLLRNFAKGHLRS